ncbi:N-acetylglucosamine-6-sulfatase-like [Clavelina lepadiformis]|uniref:N-acetylglucosamine-6-sulfatase-like n=1 Tax=Clavelina lepadiformis TaxID=159417 RepID=UPI004040F890
MLIKLILISITCTFVGFALSLYLSLLAYSFISCAILLLILRLVTVILISLRLKISRDLISKLKCCQIHRSDMLCLCFLFVILHAVSSEENLPSHAPNIVLILTDDQDKILGGMTPMVKVKELLQNEGTTFTNMFTPTPLCCPSRSSILTGRYSHNHNTVNNSISGNCASLSWQNSTEKETFAVFAHNAKYRTYFAGKYLNKYGKKEAGGPSHVPPGWNDWFGLVGNSKYYNFTVSDNGTVVKHGDAYHSDYLTDLLTYRSVKNIHKHRENHVDQPFLMMISTPAPHGPWNAAPQYEEKFLNLSAPRDGSFNKDGKNKHWLLRQAKNPMGEDSINYLDNAFRKRWQTLLSVDDLVAKVITALNDTGQLDNTYIIYTSDNGYHLGQFSLPIDKRQLYEFDLRIPFIVRGPGVSKNVTRVEPIVNIDIAPTIADIANGGEGKFPASMDGISLLPLFNSDKKPKWRTDFLVEYDGEGSNNPRPECTEMDAGVSHCFPDCVCEDAFNNTYSCVRTLDTLNKVDLMYCEFTDSETFVELYNHTTDPHQLNNIRSTVDPQVLGKMNQRLIALGDCSGTTCRSTLPPKLTL